MDIKTYSGKLAELGKKVEWDDCSIYDFIELRQDDGEHLKLVNVLVHNQVDRAMKGGNEVKLVSSFAKAKSKQFPANEGTNFVYAAYSSQHDRVFDDSELWNKARSSYGGIVALWGCAIVAFTLFLLGGTVNSMFSHDKDFAVLWLLGLIIPILTYLFTVDPALKAYSATASTESLAPIIASLKPV